MAKKKSARKKVAKKKVSGRTSTWKSRGKKICNEVKRKLAQVVPRRVTWPVFREVMVIVLCWGLGALTGFVGGWFISKKLTRPVRLEVRPNWLQCLTSSVTSEVGPGVPKVRVEGVQGLVDGSFDALLMVERMATQVSKGISLRDEKLNQTVEVDVTLPAAMTIQEMSKSKLCRTFVWVDRPVGGIVGFRHEERCRGGEPESDRKHPMDINDIGPGEGYVPLRFFVPEDRLFSCMFVEREVFESDLWMVPREFAIVGPFAVERWGGGQTLATESANTVVLSLGVPMRESDREEQSEDVVLCGPNLRGLVVNGVVSVGSLSRSGIVGFRIPSATHTVPVRLSRQRGRRFDLAVTLSEPNEGEASWLTLKGGARYVLFSAPSGDLSIGREHLKVQGTDRIQLWGDLQLALQFRPGELPLLSVDGRAESCLWNGMEVLPTRWKIITPSVRGGIVGGGIGFLLSLMVGLWSRGNGRKRGNSE